MYLVVEDSVEDYAGFFVTSEITEALINSCLNVGDIQILDMTNQTFLVDSNNGQLVWQKILEK